MYNPKGNFVISICNNSFYFNGIGSEQLTFYLIPLTDYLNALGSLVYEWYLICSSLSIKSEFSLISKI